MKIYYRSNWLTHSVRPSSFIGEEGRLKEILSHLVNLEPPQNTEIFIMGKRMYFLLTSHELTTINAELGFYIYNLFSLHVKIHDMHVDALNNMTVLQKNGPAFLFYQFLYN